MADHKFFNEIFLDGLLLAVRSLLFYGHTLVVMIDLTRSAFAALTAHVGSTVATEQLGCQQIVHFRLCPCRCFLVLLDLLLHPIKEVLGNDGRNAVGNYDITVTVLADVSAIFQNLRHTIDCVRIAPAVQHIVLVQKIPDFRHCSAVIIHFEGIQHKGRFHRINENVLLLIGGESDGRLASVELAFQRILRHTPADLLRKIGREVFCKTFQHGLQQDTLGAVRDRLVGRHYTDTVLL